MKNAEIKYKLILLFILVLYPPCRCQEPSTGDLISTIAEELAAYEDNAFAAETFSEQLFDLYQDPVRINSGDDNEIQKLFFLTDFQVSAITDYLRTKGKILSIFEIVNIPGFNEETVRMMVPFITLEEFRTRAEGPLRWKHSMLTNMVIKSGSKDNSQPGSPWKVLTKYRIATGNFSGGFTTEKDSGEKYFTSKPPVPDFLSANLSYNGTGPIRHFILGDFAARFGLGTNINTGMKTGLSLTAPGSMSIRNDIRPYTSTDENNFFRGVAAVLELKNLEVSMFFSSSLIDATIDESADSSGLIVRSLYKTGYHNTPSSLSKMNSLNERIWAINLSLDLTNLRTGILLSQSHFSIPFLPDTTNPANIYDFRGSDISVYTFYYNSRIKRFLLSAEISFSGDRRLALVQCLSFRPADRLSLNILYRYYSPRFVSFHGNGPGIISANNNEQGILGNVTFEAARHLFISAGSDVTTYKWLRYRNSSPSFSVMSEIKISYIPSERLTFETLYKCKTKEADDTDNTGVPLSVGTVTRSFRTRLSYSPDPGMTFITRLDYKKAQPGSDGFLLLQDMNVKLKKIPLSVWIRYCIFNTGGYDSGIYTWENDLLSGFSIPVMYGTGNRCYLMISLKPWRYSEVRIKYGFTTRRDSEDNLNEFSELKIQLKGSF